MTGPEASSDSAFDSSQLVKVVNAGQGSLLAIPSQPVRTIKSCQYASLYQSESICLRRLASLGLHFARATTLTHHLIRQEQIR